MKTKILSLFILVIITLTLFSGCSSKKSFTAELYKGDEVIVTATDNAETELKAVKTSDGTLLFKNIKISENKGLFYNSYTVSLTTNVAKDTNEYQLKTTMPGSIGQSKGGKIDGDTVTFEIFNLNQENEFAVYSDSNNTVTVVVIICVLAAIAVGFFYFMKRKQG